MATKPDPVTLRTRYTEQAVADLAENRRRQAELLSHLEVLQQEEALLLGILNVTGDSAEASPQPEAARPSSSSSASPARTDGPTDISPDAPAPEGEPSASGKSDRRRGGAQQPLLREILLELLSAHTEPRAAKDVWQECLEKHPDRSPSNQVVRNTLEGLVARGAVARHKRKHTVMYTLAKAS